LYQEEIEFINYVLITLYFHIRVKNIKNVVNPQENTKINKKYPKLFKNFVYNLNSYSLDPLPLYPITALPHHPITHCRKLKSLSGKKKEERPLKRQFLCLP
jgi:hypothetical protein